MKWLKPLQKLGIRNTGLFLGPLLFTVILLSDFQAQNPAVKRMAAVLAFMAVYWVTEALPLAVTSLFPFVLFPILDIMPGKNVAPNYINSTIFLFIGGFLLALAMERWNLHRRIAFKIIGMFGEKPVNLILGFMISSMILSMWISNTATALIMLPIALAVFSQIEGTLDEKSSHRIALALLLGVAYSCSVGGIATLVGSPPNLVFQRFMQITYSNAEPITFGQWFAVGLPTSIVMVAIIWLFLTRVMFRLPADVRIDRTIIRQKYKELGKTSFEEKIVMTVFFMTAALWVFRSDLNLGFVKITGWSSLLGLKGIDDGTVAIFSSLLLFLLPSKQQDRPRILEKDILQKIPWGIVLLFGGGFALAKGFQSSGLDKYFTSLFSGAAGTHPVMWIVSICIGVSFLTEFTSNTASTHIILPILAAAAVAGQINPLLVLIPATFSASMAFMMPVATPPNAIIFASERVKIGEMVRAGFLLNFIGAMVVTLAMVFIARAVFNIDFLKFPAWAG